MDVQGTVVFRNVMRSTTHIKIETSDKQVMRLRFRRSLKGRIGGVALGTWVEARVEPVLDQNLFDVIEFAQWPRAGAA